MKARDIILEMGRERDEELARLAQMLLDEWMEDNFDEGELMMNAGEYYIEYFQKNIVEDLVQDENFIHQVGHLTPEQNNALVQRYLPAVIRPLAVSSFRRAYDAFRHE